MKEQKNRMVNDFDRANYAPFQDPNYTPEDPEKAKLVLKLGNMITDRYLVKYTRTMNYSDPEYWMLDELLTKEEVRVMLSFGKTRMNKDLEEIAKLNNMSVEHAKDVLQHLMWIGVVETNRDNDDRHLQYNVPIFVPGSAEFAMINTDLVKEHPRLATFFNLMTQMPLEGITPMVPAGGAGIGMHVIPVEKAIEANNEAVPIEKLSHWLRKYDKFSIGVCTCRRQQTMRGENCGDIEGRYCIGVGDLAEYMVLRGVGHYRTYDEVLETLRRAERHGHVHQITNIDGEDKIVGICNCSPGSCNALRLAELYNTPNMVRSAYRAHVDPEKCVACGKCVEACPVGAARLGQKLCTKQGPVRYPLSELPDETAWNADKWNPNYREDIKRNCYDTGTAPCKTACPAHLAVQGYVKMAKEGRYLDALKLIKQDNPFPAVCGAICNRRCEEACTRGMVDDPIAIDEIKKFIAAQELKEEMRYVPLCEKDEGGMWSDEFRIAVIGAGPAGMSAAFFLRQHGYPVTVFEKEERPGGMLVYGIPSFRLEKDVIDAEIEVLRKMGVEFRCGTEIGKDITIQDLRKEGYKAFYVAIGAQGGRLAGIPGEEAEGVETGVDFLRRVNGDETVKMHGDVVVVGGGNVAIDVARTAARCTDGKVTMLCLESESEMPAAKDEVAEAKAEDITICNGWGPKEILRENGKVTGIVFKKCTRVFNEEHRFAPEYDENDTITLACENVLMSIGQKIEWGSLLDGTAVETNPNGTVKADPVTLQTDEADIFVGGDVFTGPRFAIDAIAAGKAAQDSINRFVHPGNSLTIGRDLRHFIELDKDNIVLPSYDTSARQVPGHTLSTPDSKFRDHRLPFTEEQVRKEAGRCLSCGQSVVDLNRCIGCGMCTVRCEFDAIHLTRDIPQASTMVKAEDKMKLIAPYAAQREIRIVKKKLTGK
ncbi:MAG: FAD-dependent oxidoreductase [Solobacterium sp.]|nr:FAD-dependent oxidoreductase [Solobacterium sp.]